MNGKDGMWASDVRGEIRYMNEEFSDRDRSNPEGAPGSDLNPIVCSCKLVSKKEIVDAIRAGHDSFIAVRRELSVTTGCGSCLIEVDRLLEEFGE